MMKEGESAIALFMADKDGVTALQVAQRRSSSTACMQLLEAANEADTRVVAFVAAKYG